MKRFLSHLSFLIVGLLIGYLIGNSNAPEPVPESSEIASAENIAVPTANQEETNAATRSDLSTEKSEPAATATSSEAETKSVASSTPAPSKASVETTPAKSAPAVSASSSPATSTSSTPRSLPVTDLCISDEKEWSQQLTLFAEDLERKKLPYTQNPPELLQDCSGIFFRIAQFTETKCSSYQYPDHTKTRSSRSIAQWYHDNNNLVIVEDPLKSRNLIKPGSVMFFGRSGERYSNITIERLAGTASQRGAITHIGVVTEVKYDDKGKVIGYVMMHGRRKGVPAQRTHYHQLDPPRLGYPILGNWNQQWVAIANIMTPKGGGSVASTNTKSNTPKAVSSNTSSSTASKTAASAESKPATSAKPSQPAPVAKPAAKPAKTTASASGLPVTNDCITDEDEWTLQLTLFAEELEKKKLDYTQSPPELLQDCSGIFFRIAQFVEGKCGSYQYPDHTKTRDSRSIARWFHDQNNLVIVQDAKAKRNLIRPGSVMFFGRAGERYSNLTIEKIAGTPGQRGVITHIGVVTEVKRDESGEVIGYVMMHGRRKGVHAQRSHYHAIDPPRAGYPVLGNWNQQWLAVANIMTPKSEGQDLASAKE